MTLQQALTEGARKPNMSRRTPTAVLVAFPTFDRCDSLVFLPSTLTRLINSDDIAGAAKLCHTHMRKDCIINYRTDPGTNFTFNLKSFLYFAKLTNILEPDRVMCVHSTKVVDNQIRATVYMKLTDTQMLYRMNNTHNESDAQIAELLPQDRTKRFTMHSNGHPDSSILQLSRLDEDLLLYLKYELIMTFDDVTKKVYAMDFTFALTSVHTITSKSRNK